MAAVRVSKNFQVIIPKEVRERLKIKPGDELDVFHIEDAIEMIPIKPIDALKGRFKEVDSHVDRPKKRA